VLLANPQPHIGCVWTVSNNLKDFGLKKSLKNLAAVRQTLAAIADRFAAFDSEALNVQVDFPLFQRLPLPITAGRTRVSGIKIHDTRMIRLMEVLLHSGTKIPEAICLYPLGLESYTANVTTFCIDQHERSVVCCIRLSGRLQPNGIHDLWALLECLHAGNAPPPSEVAATFVAPMLPLTEVAWERRRERIIGVYEGRDYPAPSVY